MSTTDQSQTQAQSQVVNDTTMSKSNELFDEEQKIDVELNDSNAAAAASSGVKGDTRERVSWLNASFFLSDQRLLFGTWSVFSATLLNVFSVIMLIRSGWMVANAGVLASLLVILVAILIALISVTSAVGKNIYTHNWRSFIVITLIFQSYLCYFHLSCLFERKT